MTSVRNYIIAAIIAIVLLALVFLVLKPATPINISNKTIIANLTEDSKAILEKYNLNIVELAEDRLVLQENTKECSIFIFPTILEEEEVVSSIKNEFNIPIIEENLDNRYIYVGKMVKPDNITLYKMLIYLRNESMAYVVLCDNLQKINQTYINAVDELLKAYKEIISS